LYLGSVLKFVQKISFWSTTMVPLGLHFVYKLEMDTGFLNHT